MNRLKEIAERKQEIRSLLEKGDKNINLDEIEKELRELDEEEKEIRRRQEIIEGMNDSTQTTKRQKPGETTNRANGNIYDSEEYRNAFMNYVCRGVPIPKEYRADAVTQTTDIGALVPPVTLNKIIEKIEAYGMILPLVTRTAYKTGMVIPTASVKPVATWVAEGAGSEKQKKALDGTITFGHFKLRCAVAVTLETDQMAYSAFETTLVNNIVEAMAKALETAIISGTGSGQPTGILHDDSKGAKLEVSSLDYQTLVNAEAELPMEYENGAVWCMTKKTFMQFTGMVDKNGQPIARVNYGIGGKPERILLGRTAKLTNYIDTFNASLEAGKVFAFLYNFADYTLNTNFQIGIKTYEDNDTDDIIRKMIMVCDGKPIVYDSLVKLVKAGE
ncbi:phage major capsid protein [Megamonas hypermegale]|uniref:phage major capsid protein n=1 Tax=Megamonas hypermegale TaxID=158847 RepID=UPI00195D2EF9|nr:phage major capsid protein [Megamonas hypermegale]MBM6760892.1 phage major capsid protein [Megamonas hypermegale]